MAIYSLRNNIWNIKPNPENIDAWNSLGSSFPPQHHVYCGCIVYWVSKFNLEIIYCFDFNTEEFNYLEVPETLKEGKLLVLFTIGELLAVLSSSRIMVFENNDGWRVWCTDTWIEDFFELLDKQINEEGINPKVLFLERCNTFVMGGFLDGI